MQIGNHILKNNLVVAPMAGVTDRPFRQLCKKLGAGLAVSEMVTSNSLLYGSEKTRRRANHEGEVDPISVQIAGADPQMMAEAARYNVDNGAQIIDINMGCPAKKICNVMAGSALLKDEPLVLQILRAVVGAVNVPVTLKIRTGWDKNNRNAITIAKIAEDMGIQALAMHGRTSGLGAQPQRRRADDVCPGQQRALPAQDLQRRFHDRRPGPAVVDVRHDPQHRKVGAAAQHRCLQRQRGGDGGRVHPALGARAGSFRGDQRPKVRPARRDCARAYEGRDAQPPDRDFALSRRVHRRRRRDPRRGRHRARLATQGRPDRFLGLQPAPAGHRRADRKSVV